jgi:hypothetical protein
MQATTKELEQIQGGAKLTIVVFVVVVNTQVEGLKELVIPKHVLLVIPKIGVGVKVTLIDTITHASKVFKSLKMLLKDTHVERPGSQLVLLPKPLDTIGKQLVDDLTTRVKYIITGCY